VELIITFIFKSLSTFPSAKILCKTLYGPSRRISNRWSWFEGNIFMLSFCSN